MMSKKDYEKAASIVRHLDSSPETSTATTMLVMGAFVELFRNDNTRFDETRFVRACVEKEAAA